MPDHPSWPAELVEKGRRAINANVSERVLRRAIVGQPDSEEFIVRVVLSAVASDLVPREETTGVKIPHAAKMASLGELDSRNRRNRVPIELDFISTRPVSVADLYDAEATDEERDAFMAALAEMDIELVPRSQADALAEALEENRQMSDVLLSLLVGVARKAIEHREPKPGDLVVEITTLRLPPDPDAIGILVGHDDAPYGKDDPLDGSVPMREVWDVRPLSGRSQPGQDFQRWENAEFWPVQMSPHIEAALASYRSSSSTETEG